MYSGAMGVGEAAKFSQPRQGNFLKKVISMYVTDTIIVSEKYLRKVRLRLLQGDRMKKGMQMAN